MASRRKLKKNVNYITEELFTGCLMSSLADDVDKEKAEEIFNQIVEMREEFISRISHTEPGNVKRFYKKFYSDFNTQVNDIVDAITEL